VGFASELLASEDDGARDALAPALRLRRVMPATLLESVALDPQPTPGPAIVLPYADERRLALGGTNDDLLLRRLLPAVDSGDFAIRHVPLGRLERHGSEPDLWVIRDVTDPLHDSPPQKKREVKQK